MELSEFQKFYLSLLVVQYFNKPNARATILEKVRPYQEFFDIIQEIERQFDVDVATGDIQDKIGKIVGQSRIIPNVLSKKYFGYTNRNVNTGGYRYRLNVNPIFKYKTRRDTEFNDLELNDNDYRDFIKAKITNNYIDATITGLQRAISFLFDNRAIVIDNLDMSLSLIIDTTFDLDKLRSITQAGLLPKTGAVPYEFITRRPRNETFGYRGRGTGVKQGYRTRTQTGGRYARLITL